MKRLANRFKPGWRMSVFVLVLLPLLLSLGSWQLRRGAEKEALQVAFAERAGALPLTITGLDVSAVQPPAFTRLRLSGEYAADQYYLIDNQVREGQVGYWVVHWFATNDGRWWLVNRGFVAAPAARSQLPTVTTPPGLVTVAATVWPNTGLVPLLQDEAPTSLWPQRRQRLDTFAMAAERELGQPLELRLEPGQPGLLVAAPTVFASGADRHHGYALQWFSLAAVLMAGYLMFGLRMANRNSMSDNADL